MTEIVVDVGALAHAGGPKSIDVLVETYEPALLFAFDPLLADSTFRLGSTFVMARRLAAWTYAGAVPFIEAGTGSRVATGEESVLAQSFDFPAWLATLPEGAIVKFDCEGAEYPLLHIIYALGLDAHLGGLLIEWHGEPLDLPFRCPVEAWTL